MYVPSPPPPQATPRVRELAQRIADVVRSYKQSHPDLRFAEIRHATRLAVMTVRAEMRGGQFDSARLLPAILGALVLLLGLGVFFGRQYEDPQEYATAAVAVAVAVVGLIVVFLARRRSLK